MYSQGDIVLVPFPFSNHSQSKLRHAIIVSNGFVNETKNVILAAITSLSVDAGWLFEISNKDVDTPFHELFTKQNISCKNIMTIHKTLIIKKISAL